ncbi:hypothetical protein M758_12G073500 [Ceratodon purpureus]|uniref:Uncharacterized protein n=1 Tax=Ceratodon purpureus TaxID=3225 RepID=A0A8T0G4I6_CERPU|nr:hypothetical protein KC19_12G069400 [Ceratodon purpureus]KAG0598439.1 hypothetical protein M758_12G073500 [Ceratodon purpureus]
MPCFTKVVRGSKRMPTLRACAPTVLTETDDFCQPIASLKCDSHICNLNTVSSRTMLTD